MRTRQEHLEWCKERANDYLDKGDIENAVASMMSDLGKHPETENHPAKSLGISFTMMPGGMSYDQAKRYIDGFN